MLITAVDRSVWAMGGPDTPVRPHRGRDGQVAGEVGDQGPGEVGPVGHRVGSGARRRGPAVRPRRGRSGRPRPRAAARARPWACRRERHRPGPRPGGWRVAWRITSAGGRVEEHGDRGAPPVTLADGDHRRGEGPPPVGDVDVEPEGQLVVDGPGEDGVGGAHTVVGKLLRRGHDGLGQQLAAVDHPTGAPVAGPDVAVAPPAGRTSNDARASSRRSSLGSGRSPSLTGRRPPGSAAPTRRSTTSW